MVHFWDRAGQRIRQRASRSKIVRLAAALLALPTALAFVKSYALHATDRGDWIRDGVFARRYPYRKDAYAELAENGISVLINLDKRKHNPASLTRYGLTEVHFPVRDYTAPSPDVLDRGVAAIVNARAEGRSVCVHCGGGRGRTGTLLACYLIHTEGRSAKDAIAEIRRLRPGSVETRSQHLAVERYEHRERHQA